MFNQFIATLLVLIFANFAFAETSTSLSKSILIAGVVEQNGALQVFINSREVWNIDHSLTDTYSNEEQVLVEEITTKLNLCNLMESTYEPCKENKTAKQLRTELTDSGVEINSEFEAWITNEVLGK